jgi:plastocyanin
MRYRAAVLPVIAVFAGFTAVPVLGPVIGQKGKVFSQAEVTIKAGEKLVFRNDDDVQHNVFSSTPGFAFNVVTMKPGTDHDVSWTREGSFDVRCAFHPTMKLKVTVTK